MVQVMGFFASTDRVTYLFNQRLQSLLRSVLFEAGCWVAEEERGTMMASESSV